MDTDNGDYLAPTNSELLALNNTNKPSIFGLVSQLAKNVEKNTPGKFRVVANPINLHFRLASISSIDEGDFGHGKKTPLCNSVFQLGRIWVKTTNLRKLPPVIFLWDFGCGKGTLIIKLRQVQTLRL